eukprot:IDg1286t1
MRWQLRLAEYEFEVHYKKGKLNSQADALSRLTSNGHTTEHENTEPPCLIVDIGPDDIEEGEDPYPFAEEADSAIDALRTVFCQDINIALQREEGVKFRENQHTGALELALPKDEGEYTVVVSASLQPRLLQLAHYPQIAVHPGGSELARLAHESGSLLPSQVNAVTIIPTQRSAGRSRDGPLVPPAPLRARSHELVGHRRPVPKLVQAVPMKGTNSFQISKAFTTNWAFVYSVPKTVLTDNGPQFCAKFLRQTHRVLGVKPQFPTTYYPKANAQTERFNRTILASLRRFLADHPKDWDLYADALIYAYNNKVHAATGCSLMELVVSRAPPHFAIEQFAPTPNSTRTARQKLLTDLASTWAASGTLLTKRNSDTRKTLTGGYASAEICLKITAVNARRANEKLIPARFSQWGVEVPAQ